MVRRAKVATLVVVGDIGRSPRMCYHAKSLADKNYRVQIVGYTGSLAHPSIQEHPNISFIPLGQMPDWISSLRPTFALALKFIWTLIALLVALFFRIDWPVLVMVQNPPGVPALFACWLCSRLRRAQFVIDWHNYSYSVLRMKYGVEDVRLDRLVERRSRNAPNVAVEFNSGSTIGGESRAKRMTKVEREVQAAAILASKRKRQAEKKKRMSFIQKFVENVYSIEGYFGLRADLNICVTHAMRQDMRDSWGITAATVYDRPPSWSFRKLNEDDRHKFLIYLSQTDDFKIFRDANCSVTLNTNEDIAGGTRFSYHDRDGKVHLRSDRPMLFVSSTSWTEDEDFGILLDALREYDGIARLSTKANPSTRLPTIICVITGRGPQKSYYLGRIEHLQMQNVEIIAPWLQAEDYPRLLGSADLGVSLHTSTSGLDLPMKIVDMFGCGLPVIAKRFRCISELVSDGFNGRLFDSSHELSQLIKSLSCGFPTHATQLSTLKNNIESDPLITWNKNWDACMWPFISSYGSLSAEDMARRRRFSVLQCTSRNGVVDSVDDLIENDYRMDEKSTHTTDDDPSSLEEIELQHSVCRMDCTSKVDDCYEIIENT